MGMGRRSEVFDVIRLTKAILQEVESSSTRTELNSLQKELLESLRGKRFLLVLDDVWNDDAEKWEKLLLPLKSGAQGSRILVTTRSKRVADIMNAAYVHELQGLSEDLSWTLFTKRAFAGRTAEEYSELESTGREIAEKCKGIPLSIKVMGSAMNSKRTRADWQNILDSKMWSLPQVSDKILPALMLSYYYLPLYLKQCFAYCSIYWKGTEMEKDELVKLWVAQGFIQPQGNREMEDIGEYYFNDLVACSMFQEVRGTYQKKTTCKMHDLLHNLAEFITKDESYIFTGEKSNQRSVVDVRHVSLFLSQDNPCFPMASVQAKKLRTLFVHRLHKMDTILDDLFHQARFLRVLAFRWCGIEMLPETIGKLRHLRYLDLSWSKFVELPNAFEKMKHLRYLDLSQSKIVELPESMCHLINLHTLNLNLCQQLKKLPRGMGRMVSLRHLQIEWTDSLECLPKGLGRISCLRNLCKFMVGGEGGCRIDELQQLNCLQGSLEISHLERLTSPEEAKKAELWNKSELSSLVFSMSSGSSEEIVMSGRNDAEKERVENVLDGLRPHANLESLTLNSRGSSSKFKLPRWMEDSLFSRLTYLSIWGFSHCEQNLPGLGKLPALKYLQLWEVGVRKIGDEFYYGMSSNDVDGKRRGEAFRKLERLELKEMSKLEEWKLTWIADDPKVMSSLRELKISNCPELQVLPPHLAYAPLSNLAIEGVEALTCLADWLGQLESLEHLSVTDCHKLKWLPHALGQLKKLKCLMIYGAEAVTHLPDSLGQLESLEELEIHANLESLPHSLGQLKKLNSLIISGDGELSCLPDSLGQLETLEHLAIRFSRKLESLPQSLGQLKKLKYLDIEGSEAFTRLPDSLGQLESLKQLEIKGCQKWVLLPYSLGQLQKLNCLERSAEALTRLPDSLGQVESLKELTVNGCQKLASLPHSLGQLKKLEYLDIEGAEALTCLPDSLGQLESLKRLLIKGCQKLVSLPHSLGQLKKLNILEIGAEELTHLPDSLGQVDSLKELTVNGCQKLVSLPHSLGQLKKLEYLDIEGAEALTCLPDSLGQLESLKRLQVKGCQKLVSLPNLFGQLKKLNYLEIGAELLTHLPDSLGQVESLKELTVNGCQKLVSLPHSLGHLKELEYLDIEGAKALTHLPDSLVQLKSLKQLQVKGCQKLVSLPHSLGQLKKLNYLEIGAESLTRLPDSLGQVESLKELTINGCQKLPSLPHSLGKLKKLNYLEIECAEALTRLPDSIGQLKSLEHLEINGCQKLVSLPHSLQDLYLLRRLDIWDCPLLLEKCRREGVDWPKISHIRIIAIDGQLIKW